MNERTGCLLSGAVAACSLLGCPAVHELQVSDTATNWLAVCTSDADCNGAARCEQQLCTLPCPGSGAAACAAIDARATCSAVPAGGFRCDLACAASEECAALGADLVCSEGHCRQGRAQSEPTPDVDLPLTAVWGVRGATDTTSFDVDPTAAMLLSDLNLQASVPVVQWRGDHWNVAWTALGTSFDGSFVEPRLYTAAVTPTGQVERRAMPFAERGVEQLESGQAARVARTISAGAWWNGSGTCAIDLADSEALAVLPPFSFECGGEVAATPVHDSEDWLVLWPRDAQSGGPTPTGLMLARYRPSEARWVAGPWHVASAELNGMLAVGSAGDAAWVVWGEAETTFAVMVFDAAGSVPVRPRALGSVRNLRVSGQADSHPTLVRSGPDALMFAADGSALLSVQLRADGTVGAPIPLAPTSVFDRPPGVASIPEQELFAVCYPVRSRSGDGDGDQVALVTVDRAGALVGGPQAVAEGIENVGGCDVAWSGSELLVAWWDIALNAPRVDPMSSTVRARVVPLP